MTKKISVATLVKAKAANEKSVWLTAYDTTSAQLAEAADVDVLLVGDSLGMVSLGFDSTIPVTLDHMIHHTAAVVRGRNKAWVVCDLPFGSYQQSKEQAFETSVRVLQETGCDAVKLEGGTAMAETIRFLSDRGIAVVAHIGLTPQSVKKFGSYRARGGNPEEYQSILRMPRLWPKLARWHWYLSASQTNWLKRSPTLSPSQQSALVQVLVVIVRCSSGMICWAFRRRTLPLPLHIQICVNRSPLQLVHGQMMCGRKSFPSNEHY